MNALMVFAGRGRMTGRGVFAGRGRMTQLAGLNRILGPVFVLFIQKVQCHLRSPQVYVVAEI